MTTLNALQKRARKLLSDYEVAKDEARTPITRALAETFVEARSHFQNAEGEVDWRGKTYPYRQWVREIFDDANLRGEDSKRVQAAIRYHVGTALRARLSDEDLESLGLISQSPRERSHDRRASRSAVLNALTAKDVAGGSLMALTAINAIVKRVDVEEVRTLDDNARAVALATLVDLERRVRALKRALN